MTSMSILDQSPIAKDERVGDGISRTVALAQLADRLNYKRFFVSEHHNIPEVVGTSPEILVTHLLNQTEHIRIGSGGVMLQHYSPFKVIEQFHFMSQIAPNRVDLGVGKAPGGFPLATQTLQSELKSPALAFEEKFQLLNRFNRHDFQKDEDYHNLQTAIRADEVSRPEVFLLGASENSAILAAKEKVGFVFAYFINSDKEILHKAIRKYKSEYPEGRVIVTVATVITDNEAERQMVEAGRTNYALHFEDGRKITVNTKEQLDDFTAQSTEQFQVTAKQTGVLSGDVETIKSELNQLNRDGAIDEFMIHMPVANHALRVKTVEQLAPATEIYNKKVGIV
ncbi:MsnO8 family LLM class oxidoreductase [Staphylococcus caeli]|uniref:MsnO8 family LLM class oxidoreductase n=1 Tax=Staphylococcus caeli TaxID=2201815 RepID=UPI003F545DBD